MKLLSIITARSLWFFDVQDLNPRGKDLTEDLIDWIKEGYNFTGAPDASTVATELSAGKGLAFTGGSFQAREEFFVPVNFTMFSDGFLGETKSSTHDSDAFLEDLLTSASKEFGLSYEPSMILRKNYVSEMIVRPDRTLAGLNPKLKEFSNRLKSLTPNAPDFEVAGLSLWTSPPVAGSRPFIFSFERQANKPFQERRYYSQAPVQTEDHIKLLEEFEQILPV
ncbi:MAG TPA: hypothetical protein VEV17_12900 [Bryobacteraceae bacterium]|nr:hypothetical protein [Bryobacteraceae bacterium]